MTDAPSLYDEDFVAWTREQAEALRAAARSGANLPLDWENLAEEIESLGKSDRRELRSQIYRIIRHLAKLQFSPTVEPRHGWRESIRDGRLQVGLVLADSPSLRREVNPIVIEQTRSATTRAIADLDEYGEIDRALRQALQGARYSEEQVVGDWFPPAPDAE